MKIEIESARWLNEDRTELEAIINGVVLKVPAEREHPYYQTILDWAEDGGQIE